MMYEKGVAYSLKEVGEKFLAFAQRSNSNTQAWELIDNRLSSFYGATLRVPMNNRAVEAENYKYYILGDSFLDKEVGTSNFKDYLTNTYNNIIIIEDYSCNSLDAVLSYLQTNILYPLNIKDKIKIIFNGVENNIGLGETTSTVMSKVENIINQCKNLGIETELFVTPSPIAYSSATTEEYYKNFVNCSKITKKPVVVCVGDALTSYTNALQSINTDIYVSDKSNGIYTVQDVINRFNNDVIEQLPDMCIIWIGSNDMWSGNSTTIASSVSNVSQMINDCISHDIVPVLCGYEPTLAQINNIPSSSPSWVSPKNIYYNFLNYYSSCKTLADTYKITFLRPYEAVKVRGEVDSQYLNSDGFTWSTLGQSVIGTYISDNLQYEFTKLIGKVR